MHLILYGERGSSLFATSKNFNQLNKGGSIKTKQIGIICLAVMSVSLTSCGTATTTTRTTTTDRSGRTAVEEKREVRTILPEPLETFAEMHRQHVAVLRSGFSGLRRIAAGPEPEVRQGLPVRTAAKRYFKGHERKKVLAMNKAGSKETGAKAQKLGPPKNKPRRPKPKRPPVTGPNQKIA